MMHVIAFILLVFALLPSNPANISRIDLGETALMEEADYCLFPHFKAVVPPLWLWREEGLPRIQTCFWYW